VLVRPTDVLHQRWWVDRIEDVVSRNLAENGLSMSIDTSEPGRPREAHLVFAFHAEGQFNLKTRVFDWKSTGWILRRAGAHLSKIDIRHALT
jgi:hypothetical protein